MSDSDHLPAYYDEEAHAWVVVDGEERFAAWQSWHDEHCTDPHYERVFEPLRTTVTIDASPYL